MREFQPTQDFWATSTATGAQAPPAGPLREIGSYELLEELGHGGMGLVFKGRDANLDREVAVKVLLDKHKGRPDLAHRFLKEARINGQLQHPGIVPVYELGQFADRQPYFAMKLVEGRTLAELLHERSEPAQERARFAKIFEQICQTLAYAHARGVIHRDLKPHNVMVGAFGEVQVMDWGLAKEMRNVELGLRNESRESAPSSNPHSEFRTSPSEETEGIEQTPYATQAGVGLGTVAYMPPEQARGDADRIDTRSDVFGLGAILCEVLTGQPPYRSPDAAERFRQAKDADLSDALSRLDACGADTELISLATRCLAAQPDLRPRDAGVLAGEVTAYLESVDARLRRAELDRAAAVVEAREQRRRRKLTLGLATAVVMVLGLLGGGAMWLQSQRTETERNVEAALAKAEQAQAQFQQMPAGNAEETAAAIQVLQQAQAAAAEAESVLQTGVARDELETRVADLGGRIDQEFSQLEKEHRLFTELDAARMARMAGVIRDDPAALLSPKKEVLDTLQLDFDYDSCVARYAAAFDAFGIAITDQHAATQSAIRRRRPAIRAAIIAAVDDWAYVANRIGNDAKPTEAALLALASDIDDDPFRRRVREWRERRFRGEFGDEPLVELVRNQPATSLEMFARTLISAGRRQDAVTLLRLTCISHPRDFWLHFYLAEVLQDEGRGSPADLQEVIGSYVAAAALRPDSDVALVNLGTALQAAGDYARAILAYEQALAVNPLSAAAQLNRGHSLDDVGRGEESLAAYRRAVELAPHWPAAHRALGQALARASDFGGAIESIQQAIALSPKDAKNHFSLGLVGILADDLEGAAAACRQATELDPQYLDAHTNLSYALIRLGDWPGALAAADEALMIDPRDAFALVNKGSALVEMGRAREAVTALQAAIEIDEKNAAAHASLGSAWTQLQEYDSAMAACRRAKELDPQLPLVHNVLGVTLAARDDHRGAIAAFEEAIRLNPKFAEAQFNLGFSFSELGDEAAAIAAYRAAVAIRPKFLQAYHNLGNALIGTGDFAGAAEAFKAVVEINPRGAEAHFTLAEVLAMQGKFAEAEAAMRKCLEVCDRADMKAAIPQRIGIFRELAELEAKLTEVLLGRAQPANDDERMGFATVALRQHRYAAAARFFAEVFSGQMELAADLQQGHRYNAACCAARAGSGQGADASELAKEQRGELRRQAVAWLRADLAAWSAILERGGSQLRIAVADTLTHWRRDPDLAGIREAEQLAKLPAEEQQTCRALWSDVEALLLQATAKREPLEAE